MDIAVWLRELGLGRYEAAFRNDGIDVDVLPDLTENDLSQLGVTLGDRKRLLKAITLLASPSAKEPSAPARKDDAERRPITVMFCDLVGSTSLASKLDAEDWRGLVSAYLDEASNAVTQYGGHVLKKLGDGIMALFGYPKAQENDAERAARAGLAILRALDDLNGKNAAHGLPALAARIGLESGPVVVDAVGEVFGDAPNVAARVQSAAEPGTLLVTAAVQRQVAGLFVAEDKGPHELKGVPSKPTLYRLVRASGGARRASTRSLTPLVGREEELAQLARRWERAHGGEGQFVLIVGEPGLGKSRLIQEFRARLGATPYTWVEWATSQLLQNTPLHPLADWGRQRFASEARLAELEAALGSVKLAPDEYAPLLAPLLDIPLPEDRAPKLAADELRRQQLAAVVAWMLAGARTQPIVLAIEDLHWADPTTLDLMKTLAERGARGALLICATTRPEFRATWTTRSHHGVISLVPLDRAQIREMVSAIAECHALANDAVEGLSDRTGGVPLFVEELTRLMLEGGAQTIPPTLQQLLAARLDRLGEAREVAQIGAVLGREFSYGLLQAVANWSGSVLDAALEKLTEADLLFVDGAAPASTYRFKHALIQDAAYESLLKTRRQVLHRRAAEALIAAPDPHPELVAHHFTQSNQTELAIEWWGKAGDAALRRSAFQEAISHLGKAIGMADAQNARETDAGARANPALSASRAKLQASFGQALIWTKGYSAQETTAAFAKAVELADQTESSGDRCAGYYGVWIGALTRGEPERVREMAARFAQEIEARPASPEAIIGHRILGMTHFVGGNFAAAARHLREVLQLYDRKLHTDLSARFGQDPGPSARIYLAQSLWIMGKIDEALTHADLALAEAQSNGYPPTTVLVLVHKPILGLLRGDRDAVAAESQDLADLVVQHELPPLWSAQAEYFRGWVSSQCGDREAAIFAMRSALRVLRDQRQVLHVSFLEPILAKVEEGDAGLTRLDDAFAEMEKTGYRAYEAETHRIRGELLLTHDLPNAALAEEAFLAAITVAQEQGARSFELRAALALARLYHSNGRSADAHSALAPALEGFPPTSAFPEIAEAQALVAVLEDTDAVRRERRNRGIRSKYAQAVMITEGYTSEATQAAYERIGEESVRPSKAAERFPVLYGQWTQSIRGDMRAGLAVAQTQLREGEAAGLGGMAASALRQMSICFYQFGRFAEARRHAECARELYDEAWAAEVRAVTGADFLAILECYLAVITWPTGDVHGAYAHLEAAIARAEMTDPTYTLVNVSAQALYLTSLARRPEETLMIADRAIAVAADKGVGAWDAPLHFFRTWAHGRLHDPPSGIINLRTAWNDLRACGMGLFDYIAPALLADLQVAAGVADDALATIAEGLRACADTGLQRELANLHTLRGDVLSARTPTAAEASYREAIAVARDQGARTFELLAALPLEQSPSGMNRNSSPLPVRL